MVTCSKCHKEVEKEDDDHWCSLEMCFNCKEIIKQGSCKCSQE